MGGRLTAMPLLGRRMAKFNKRATNRVTVRFAGRAPLLGILVHQGRRSGRAYQTPVNVFRVGDGFRLALTYGKDSEWVRNVMAAGGAGLTTRGREYRLADPRLVEDHDPRYVPAPMRAMLKALGVTDFLQLRIVDPG